MSEIRKKPSGLVKIGCGLSIMFAFYAILYSIGLIIGFSQLSNNLNNLKLIVFFFAIIVIIAECFCIYHSIQVLQGTAKSVAYAGVLGCFNYLLPGIFILCGTYE